jgi:hypothetical protein
MFVCEAGAYASEVPLMCSTAQLLHPRVGYWPYPQTWKNLKQAGKPARDKNSSLLQRHANYRRRKFHNIEPSVEVTVSDNHSSLLQCIINYEREKFFWPKERKIILVAMVSIYKCSFVVTEAGSE